MKEYLKMADVFDLPILGSRAEFFPLCLNESSAMIAAHAINSHDELVAINKELLEAMGEHLAEQDAQPLCMAKRIEELEAQVRVMAELLRDARKYVTALGKPDDEVPAVQMTVSRIDALLAGQVPEPVYYMRDNHTFKRLSNDVDTAITEIEVELDAGWTSGMLCSKRKGFSSLHANYRRSREEFISDCRDAMLAAAILASGFSLRGK